MIFARYFLTLVGIIALQSTGSANFLEANNEQACIDLCKKCDGSANFDDSVCQCHVADDNQRGAECIGRIKRQAGELGLDIVSCDLADTDADRAARCVLSPLRRFKSQSDADLIAKYFMGGLGGLGAGLLGSKSKPEGSTLETKDSASSSAAENVDSNLQSTGNTLDSDPAVVGASNPFDAANPIPMGTNSLLGAAAAWLHPNTLFNIGNGLQGAGNHNFVGQPGPNPASSSTSQTNFVGLSHQDTGDSPSLGAPESYSTYPAGTIVGMAPYSYVVGAPNPVQLQDGSQGIQMQPYLYTYNSMVGAQNPLFLGGDRAGLSSYWNYATPLTAMNSPQSADPAAGLGSSLGETVKAAEEPLNEPNSDHSLGAKKDTNLEEKTDELESASDEIEEPVVSSKQTDQNLEKDVTDEGKVKVQARDTSNYRTNQRQNSYRLKAGGAKSES